MNARYNRSVLSAALFGFALAIATPSVSIAGPLAEKVSSTGELTIGIHNRAPWGYRTEEGTVSGVHPDVVKAVSESLGVDKVNFVVMEWGALIPSLASRRIDAVASGMAITPERCKQVAFSESFLTAGDAALVKAGNPFDIHSYTDIAKSTEIRVGDARGATTTASAVSMGVEQDRIQMFQDYNDLVSALISDRVDVIFMTSGTALGFMNDPNIKGIERAAPFVGQVMDDGSEAISYTAVGFRPEDADFRDKFNENLAEKVSDGAVWDILEGYGFQESELPDGSVTTRDICEGNYQ